MKTRITRTRIVLELKYRKTEVMNKLHTSMGKIESTDIQPDGTLGKPDRNGIPWCYYYYGSTVVRIAEKLGKLNRIVVYEDEVA